MYSKLQERCEIEFERYVAGVYSSEPDHCGHVCASVPWARGGWCFTKAGIPGLIREIRAALDARIWFSKHGPGWAQPLPLGEDCVAMLRMGGPPHLLGLYAFSLQLMNYDYLGHPQLYDFCCGVMAHPSAPKHVRDDPELKAEFPPQPLPGLCGRLVWFGESLTS